MLTDKAQFWIVKPRFFAGALSGLETLVSGSYIELQPSAAGGQPETHFTGLETPPVLTSDVPGHTFLLTASRLGNITLGSPVFFRDLDVGEVLGWDLGNMAETVTVHAFVRAPFDQYVHDNSRFWNDSGAKVSLGPNGLQLQVELAARRVAGRHRLRHARTRGAASRPARKTTCSRSTTARTPRIPPPSRAACISWRISKARSPGWRPTAAVTLHGIKIGEVSSVGLQYDKSHRQRGGAGAFRRGAGPHRRVEPAVRRRPGCDDRATWSTAACG